MKWPIVICFVLCIIGCSNYEHAKYASVTIKLKQCPNQTIIWKNPYDDGNDTIKLDSTGETVITVPAEQQKQFIRVYAGCIKEKFTVFIDSDFDIVFHGGEKEKFFTGKGASINNYLCKVDSIHNVFFDSTFNIHEVNDIKKLTNDLEEKYANLYNASFKNEPLTKEMEYIFKTHTQASILGLKQAFLYNFNPSEVTSLNLEHKVGLNTNEFLNDTLLVNLNSSYFESYIENSLNFYYLKTFITNDNADTNTQNSVNIIENAKQYSRPVKNYLLFRNLIYNIKSHGPNFFTDSIINKLIEDKKISPERNQMLSDVKKEFYHLLPGKPAPDLRGVSQNGEVITLKDLKGKVVFIDIWATWCAPCIETLPHVLELENLFINNKDVVFLFLSNDSEEKKWKEYLTEHPEFKGIQLRSREEDRPFEELWKVSGIPRYILVDKQGNIIDAFARNNSYEKLQEIITIALGKSQPI